MSNAHSAPDGPVRDDGPAAVPASLSGQAASGESVIRGSCLSAFLVSVAITIGIIVALIRPVLDFFARSASFGDSSPERGHSSPVLPLVAGTFMITAIALLVAVPLGLGAAMYLSEYASDAPARSQADRGAPRRRPLVVYGFFALAFVTPRCFRRSPRDRRRSSPTRSPPAW